MLACLLSFYCLLNISVDSESDMFYTLIHLDFSVCALCHIMEFKWFKTSFTHNNTVNGANARFASTASIPSASLDVRVDTHLWLVTKCNNCFHLLYTSVFKNSGQESCLYYFFSCCQLLSQMHKFQVALSHPWTVPKCNYQYSIWQTYNHGIWISTYTYNYLQLQYCCWCCCCCVEKNSHLHSFSRNWFFYNVILFKGFYRIFNCNMWMITSSRTIKWQMKKWPLCSVGMSVFSEYTVCVWFDLKKQ